nr:unnamed protein product [Callosobruchus analis]
MTETTHPRLRWKKCIGKLLKKIFHLELFEMNESVESAVQKATADGLASNDAKKQYSNKAFTLVLYYHPKLYICFSDESNFQFLADKGSFARPSGPVPLSLRCRAG